MCKAERDVQSALKIFARSAQRRPAANKDQAVAAGPPEDDSTGAWHKNQAFAILVPFFAALVASVTGSNNCYPTLAQAHIPNLVDRGASHTNTTASQPRTNL